MDVSDTVATAAAWTAAQAVAAHPPETGLVVAAAAADSSTANCDVSGQHRTCQNAYYCVKGMWFDLDSIVMRQANSNPE